MGCAKLPPPAATTVLPREKPAPKPRVPTKWEQYAASKGINKTKNAKGANAKNPRLVWDDATQEWIPGYGYKKVKADNVKNWMMHVKGGSDPMENPYEKAAEEKAKRVAKSEVQRLRNIARSKKTKMPGAGGLAPPTATTLATSKPDKHELEKAADLAKKATASLGKFQGKLADSKLEKKASSTRVKGVKRKFDPLVSSDGEEKEVRRAKGVVKREAANLLQRAQSWTPNREPMPPANLARKEGEAQENIRNDKECTPFKF